jgi:hypothetical protein
MHILRIEHAVPNFEEWMKVFASDPVKREQGGVRRYLVLRPIDDADYAMVDLEFDTLGEAEAFLVALRNLWSRVEGTVMTNPQTRIMEVVERNEY